MKFSRPTQFIPFVVTVFLLMACGQISNIEEPTNVPATTEESSPTQTPEVDEPPKLVTPSSDVPAAGICSKEIDEIVTVNIGPGPDPMPAVRCFQVAGWQRVKMVNQTDGVIQVMFGGYTITLEAQTEELIDLPFGEYLQEGVHHMNISEPFFGPVIWLVEE